MDAHLCLSDVRGQVLAEDDSWSSSDPDREVSQDRREDGPALLVSPDAVQRSDTSSTTILLLLFSTMKNVFKLFYTLQKPKGLFKFTKTPLLLFTNIFSWLALKKSLQDCPICLGMTRQHHTVETTKSHHNRVLLSC